MYLLSHPAAGWRIRHWRRHDQEQVEAIFHDSLRDFPWRTKGAQDFVGLRRAVASGHVFVAVEYNAGIVGFLTLEQDKGYVPHLFVDRDWRFCGVGSGLLKVARDFVDRPLQLDVDRMNERARAAYAALGWTELEAASGRKLRPGQIRVIGP